MIFGATASDPPFAFLSLIDASYTRDEGEKIAENLLFEMTKKYKVKAVSYLLRASDIDLLCWLGS